MDRGTKSESIAFVLAWRTMNGAKAMHKAMHGVECIGSLASRELELAAEFGCRACGSAAIVYPDQLYDYAAVRCRRCALVICTLGEFRRYAEEIATRRK